jgi:ribosomal protein L18E
MAFVTKQQRQALEELHRKYQQAAENQANGWRKLAAQATRLRRETEALAASYRR